MKSADKVFHRPSGETWILAWADDKEVSPCGWPETIAKVSDCEMVEEATQEELEAMLKKWAEMEGNNSDYRVLRCRQMNQRGE